MLYCSFGLGLRAKEMASLKVRHVLGIDGELLEEINLDSSMTKGKKKRHVFLTNSRVIDVGLESPQCRRSPGLCPAD